MRAATRGSPSARSRSYTTCERLSPTYRLCSKPVGRPTSRRIYPGRRDRTGGLPRPLAPARARVGGCLRIPRALDCVGFSPCLAPEGPVPASDDRVHLLRDVRLAGRGRAADDVIDSLRPADDDVARWVSARAVAGDALTLEELQLEIEDAPDVFGGKRRGDEVGEVLDDPLERLVHVEHRRRRFRREAAGFADDEPRADPACDAGH